MKPLKTPGRIKVSLNALAGNWLGAKLQKNRLSRQSILEQDSNSRNTSLSAKLKTSAVRKGRKQTERKSVLPDLAGFDALTNLPNRKFFHERLQQFVQTTQKEKSGLALLVLGLDRFREVNHTLGLQRGDWLLREVARRFEIVTCNSVARARLGGDEYAAVFPDTTKQNIEIVCAMVLRSLASPFVVERVPIDLSGSIGVALCPEHGVDPNLLFQRANIALDLAKQTGRSYTIYDPVSDPYNQQKFAYLGSLRNAIEQQQLVLHYQPKIDLRTRRICGLEALVRWNHPKIGLIPPYHFISVAERTGLIHPLTQWVLTTALDQCKLWHRAGIDVSVAVNLSPRDFHEDRLAKYIAGLLKERGLPPTYLELEITESLIMAETVHVSDALGRLSEMGVCAYIDDFGTGYSSLRLLKKLPVAGIKIDKSFVSQMMLDDNDAVIVRSTIELGHNLGLNVIAEGVESLAICNRLTALGCDIAQGYHMSRPKPARELDRWFAESPWGVAKLSKKTKSNSYLTR